MVFVEVDERGDPIRILKNAKFAAQLPVESVQEVPRAYAVGHIRRIVFGRAGCTPHQAGQCEDCGASIIWTAGNWKSGEMHEKVFRSLGGEISVENCVALCRKCHHQKAHNKVWHSAKVKESD